MDLAVKRNKGFEYIKNNATYYKKNIIIIFCILSATVLGFSFFLAYCDYSDASGLLPFLYSWIDDIFTSVNVQGIKQLVYIDFDNLSSITIGGKAITGLSGTITAIYKIFKNFAYMLLILYFCVGCVEEMSFNQMYIEKLVKKFVFLCVGIVLVSKSMDIVFGLANVGSAVANKVTVATSATTNTDALKQLIYDKCNPNTTGLGPLKKILAEIGGFMSQIGYVFQLFIPWLVMRIVYLIVNFACWSRFFEITFYAILSPVAMADVARGNPMQSSAMRAFKNIVALSLSGAMIMIICYMCNQVTYSLFAGATLNESNFLSTIWSSIVIGVVQMGLVSRSTEIVKQAIGIN